jgi:hypothetical protein
MLGLEVRVESANVPDRIRNLGRLFADPTPILKDFGSHVVRRLKMQGAVKPKMKPAAAGEPPAVHTRGFSKSIGSEMRGSRAIAIGSSFVGADLLQHGGVVRPVRARALAIPVDVRAYGKRPRDFSNLTLLPPVKGVSSAFGPYNLGRLARIPKRGGVERIQTLFILLRQVTIKPHPWLSITDDDWSYLGEVMQSKADKAVGP